MKKNNKKKKFRNIIIITIIVILIVILPIVILQFMYESFNFFWVDVKFENKSGEKIKITPIGIVEGRNEIGPLIEIKKQLFFIEAQNNRFDLNKGESLKITYDWDDQNLQFVVIEFPKDDIRILRIDVEFWENQTYNGGFWAPREYKYIITPKNELPLCPEILKLTIKGKYVKITDELIDIFKEL
jgi:hypothetical protein